MSINSKRACYFSGLLILAKVATLYAAEPMLNYPLEPLAAPAGTMLEPETVVPPQDPARTTVLLPALNGLVLVATPEQLLPQNALQAGLVMNQINAPDPDVLQERLNVFLGRPLSVSLLDEISVAIVNHYQAYDLPVVDAIPPEGQDISEGVVQFVVVTGKLGRLTINGNSYFSEKLLKSYVKSKQGNVIRRSTLLADLERLNNNPFRTVNLQLLSGANFAETDVLLNVSERVPFRAYAGIANTGNSLTGKDQYFAGFNWGNVFGLDHQLGYQYTGSSQSSAFVSHTLSYAIPLPNGASLSAFAAHVKSDPPPDARGFDLTGKNWQAGLRYEQALPQWRGVQQQFQAGADFKRSNNDLQFGTLRVFNTYTDIVQFNANYQGSMVDALGNSAFSLLLNYSPGGLSGDNDDAAFTASRQAASANYWYLRASVERVTRLPGNFTFANELQIQYSPKNLLGSEQFGIGGYRSVRGYNEYAQVGDQGILLRNELRAPVLQLGKLGESEGQLQLLMFVDAGKVRKAKPLPEEADTSLLSAGPGLRYTLGSNLNIRLDYGWQLRQESAAANKDEQLHLGFTLGY